MFQSPARAKAMVAKQMILRRTQHNFRRACDQIIILNKRMEAVLYRYHAARASVCRVFRYKLRLRLAIVEGIRNMFYEYANRKAFEIVNLRRDLFGEIVEVITDDNTEGRYFNTDSVTSDDGDVSIDDESDVSDLEVSTSDDDGERVILDVGQEETEHNMDINWHP